MKMWVIVGVCTGTIAAITAIAIVPDDVGRVFAERVGGGMLSAIGNALDGSPIVFESSAPPPISIPITETETPIPLTPKNPPPSPYFINEGERVGGFNQDSVPENIPRPAPVLKKLERDTPFKSGISNSLLEESVARSTLSAGMEASGRDVNTITFNIVYTKTPNIIDPEPVPLNPGYGAGFGGGGGGSSSTPAPTPTPTPTPEPTPSSPSANDIIINEIAWRGTEANSNDEWIELYNKTSNTITLASTTLYSTDGSPYITLSGTISPRSYYLIERKNDGETNESTQSPIADITADLWTSFGNGLSDGANGEHLYLAYFNGTATTTIDEINFSGCFQSWCGKGGTDYYYSMERKSPDISGLTETGWTSNRGDRTNYKNGRDQNGTAVRATPKQRNYANYLVNYGDNLESGSLTLSPSNSPYLVDSSWFTISSGATLNIEAGTTVKFNGSSGIRVNGTLNISGAVGTTTTLSSYSDTPASGDWIGVEYLAGSSGTINRATLKYGGRYSGIPSATKSLVYVANSSPTISNSTIEYSRGYGFSLEFASSTITGNTIRNNYVESDPSYSYGIYGYGGAPNISSNTFSSNYRGMLFYNSSGTFSNNTFTSNIENAFTWAGDLLAGGQISGNSGTGNGSANGITLQSGALMSSGISSTFGKNSLFPYLAPSTISVPSSSSLIAQAGSVWKFGQFPFNISGTLTTQGASENPVIFTSLSDDSDGNDAQGNASTTPYIYQNSGIYMQSGAISDFLNTTIRYMKIGASYNSSPISLENVTFDHNETGVSANSGETITKAINVQFFSNTATSTIPLN